MQLEKLLSPEITTLLYRTDIIAKDQEENPILLVDVRSSQIHPLVWEEIADCLMKTQGKFPYFMLVNLDNIELYHWDQQTPLITLKTPDILEVYDSKFRDKLILPTYLKALTEAWLNDLAYQSKMPNPPAIFELKNTGLLERLKNGSTEINY